MLLKKNFIEAKKLVINSMSREVLLVSMDMQSVLLYPKLFVFEQYYEMKLIHNFLCKK